MLNRPCPISPEELLALRDGELPLWRRAVLSRHVRACPSCQQEIAIMNQISEELRAEDTQLQPAVMPAHLRERILTDLSNAGATAPGTSPGTSAPSATATQTTAPPKAPSPPSRPRTPWLEWGAMASGCALLAVFVLTISGRRVSNTFNAAADKLSTTTDEAYTSSYADTSSAERFSASAPSSSESAGPVAGSAAPSFQNPARSARNEIQTSTKRTAESAASRMRVPSPAADTASSAASSYAPSAQPLPSSLRRVHKEARIGVAVAKVEEQTNEVENLVKSVGGFVSSNTLSTGSGGLKTAILSVRVPVRSFESVLSQVGRLGEVQSKSISGEDITERFSNEDAANRVLSSELSVKESMLRAAMEREEASRREAERRNRQLRVAAVPWQQRADVRRLRIETAQTRARMELLRKISDLSSIEIALNQKPIAPAPAGFTSEMGRTMGEAVSSFAVAVRFPIAMLIWILAYSPLWLPALLMYRLAIRHYRKHYGQDDLVSDVHAPHTVGATES